MRKEELKDRFIIVADIVGFKSFIEKENGFVVDSIVSNFFEFIKKDNVEYNGVERYGIINDTIYLVFKENIELELVFYNAYCLVSHMPTVLIQGGISKGDIVLCEANNNTIVMGQAFLNAHKYTEKYPIGMYLDYKNIFYDKTIRDLKMTEQIEKYFNYYLLSLPGFKSEEVLFLNPIKNSNYSIGELYQFLEALHTYYINANEEQKIRKFILCFLMLTLTNYINVSIDRDSYDIIKEYEKHE